MKNYLLSFSLASVVFVSSVHAAPNFSNATLQKAYEQVNIRITQKTDAMILDKSSQTNIEQKKEKLFQALLVIDDALQNRNKPKIREQVRIFRDTYRETLVFIQGGGVVHKNIPKTLWGTGVLITYYADGFEGMKTANGNPFSQSYFSAAACDIPLNTLLQVRKNNAPVIVKLNDRPNCAKYPNLIDLSKTAFGIVTKNSKESAWEGSIHPLGVVAKTYIKRLLPTDTFQGLSITLDDNIPNTYLKNETLHITGKELAGKEYVILYLKSPSWKDITLGTKTASGGRFEYNYPLEETGTYDMVMSSGLGFKTKTFLSITVLDDTVFSAKKFILPIRQPESLDKLDVERAELPDLTSVYLVRFPDNSFHTLTVQSDTKTFVYRGFRVIAMRSDALGSLGTDDRPVSVQVDSQESSTVFSHDTLTTPVTVFKKTMTLVPGYKAEQHEDITVTEKAGNLLIRGTVRKGARVKTDILVTLPNGDVEKYAFDAQDIDGDGYVKRGKVLEKSIPLRQFWLYLAEINYDNGFAAYNGPVIYGDVLPVFPNDYDGIQKEIGTVSGIEVATKSLDFVNSVRKKSGKSTLSLNETLNDLATIKANDMAKNRNISHTDSFGDKISGTAKRSGIRIAGGIGENVAGGNVYFKTLLVGLANSGGHRANMQGDWTKMGVGYAVNDGVVYYVQVFGE